MKFRTSLESRRYQNNREKLAIAPVLIAVILVILLVAGVGVYFLASGHSTSSTTLADTMILAQTSTSLSSPNSASMTSSTHNTETSSVGASLIGTSGISTYSGVFNFSLPLGPSGERVLANDTVQSYRTTQVASGSFNYFIAAGNKSGSGSGHGTLTATTTGFCSGTFTMSYTFKIPDATTLFGNQTIFFGAPTQANFTVPLTCMGPMTGVSTANNVTSFIGVYPNEINVATMPTTISQHQSGNTTYYFNINPTG